MKNKINVYNLMNNLKYSSVSFSFIKKEFKGKVSNYEILTLLPSVKNESEAFLLFSLLDLSAEFNKYEKLLLELESSISFNKTFYRYFLSNDTLKMKDFVHCLNKTNEKDIFDSMKRTFKPEELDEIFYSIKDRSDYITYSRTIALGIVKEDYTNTTLQKLLLKFNQDEFENYKKDFEVRVLMQYVKNKFEEFDPKTEFTIKKLLSKKDYKHFDKQLETYYNFSTETLRTKLNSFSDTLINNIFLYNQDKLFPIIKEHILGNNFTYNTVLENSARNNKKLNSFFIFSNRLSMDEKKEIVDKLSSTDLTSNKIIELLDYSTGVITSNYTDKERCDFFDLMMYMMKKDINKSIKLLENNDLIILKILELNLPDNYFKTNKDFIDINNLNINFSKYFEAIEKYKKNILHNIDSLYIPNVRLTSLPLDLGSKINTMSSHRKTENNFTNDLIKYYLSNNISEKYPMTLSDNINVKIDGYLYGFNSFEIENYKEVYNIIKNYEESKLILMFDNFKTEDIKQLLSIDEEKIISTIIIKNLYSDIKYTSLAKYLVNCDNELTKEKEKINLNSDFEF